MSPEAVSARGMVERLLAPTRDDHPCPALEQLARYLKSNPARPASHERALSGNIHRVPHVNQNRYLLIRCLGLPGYNAQCEGIAVTFALFSPSLERSSDLRSAALTQGWRKRASPSHSG